MKFRNPPVDVAAEGTAKNVQLCFLFFPERPTNEKPKLTCGGSVEVVKVRRNWQPWPTAAPPHHQLSLCDYSNDLTVDSLNSVDFDAVVAQQHEIPVGSKRNNKPIRRTTTNGNNISPEMTRMLLELRPAISVEKLFSLEKTEIASSKHQKRP
jgi:hypothetical protein